MQTQTKVAALTVEQAYRTERKRIFDFIRRRVNAEEDAEDILQDVFYQLATNYDVAEPIENLAGWLFTVARNKITDWYRKRKPEPISSNATNDDAPDVITQIADPSQNPEELLLRQAVWEELNDALDELPSEQRDVFVMHELEGRSFKEIAEITGAPLNTLLSRKRYAVLFLRERLQELYDDFIEQ